MLQEKVGKLDVKLPNKTLTRAWKDATTDFDDVGHSKDAIKQMQKFLIGTI